MSSIEELLAHIPPLSWKSSDQSTSAPEDWLEDCRFARYTQQYEKPRLLSSINKLESLVEDVANEVESPTLVARKAEVLPNLQKNRALISPFQKYTCNPMMPSDQESGRMGMTTENFGLLTTSNRAKLVYSVSFGAGKYHAKPTSSMLEPKELDAEQDLWCGRPTLQSAGKPLSRKRSGFHKVDVSLLKDNSIQQEILSMDSEMKTASFGTRHFTQNSRFVIRQLGSKARKNW